MYEVLRIQLDEAEKASSGRPTYNVDGDTLLVELAALRCLQSQGYEGVFSANETWWRIAFFLFWDQIYLPLDDACDPRLGEFPSPQQDIPRDLFTSKFYPRRRSQFENRVQELEHKGVVSELQAAISRHRGSPCRIVAGADHATVEAMLFVATQTPAAALVAICNRVLVDFAENRQGIPDLFLVKNGQPVLAEVKSPRDRLSEAQRNWLDWLERKAKVRTTVVAVNHSDRQAARLSESPSEGGQAITIRFGKSSSKYYKDAVALAQTMATYRAVEGRPSLLHEVTIRTGEVQSLTKMIDYVYRWKGTEISADDKLVPLSDVRVPLKCFHEKTAAAAGRVWCNRREYDEKNNLFGCRLVELEQFDSDDRSWTPYGYIDSATGEFILRVDQIRAELLPQIEQVRLCPVFRSRRALTILDDIPERVNPGQDKGWAYEVEYVKWMRGPKGWISQWGDTAFPGAKAATGAAQYTSKDLREAEAERREQERDDQDLRRELEQHQEGHFASTPLRARKGCALLPGLFLLLGSLGALVVVAALI